jgi:deoxyribodipyrimidine photolyase-related protein
MKHHEKKLAFFFSVMRHFASELRAEGWHADYVPTDKPGNTGSFTGEIKKAVALHGPNQIFVTESQNGARPRR